MLTKPTLERGDVQTLPLEAEVVDVDGGLKERCRQGREAQGGQDTHHYHHFRKLKMRHRLDSNPEALEDAHASLEKSVGVLGLDATPREYSIEVGVFWDVFLRSVVADEERGVRSSRHAIGRDRTYAL